MTAWPSVYGSTTLVAATVVTTAETVVCQVPIVTDGAAAVFLMGFVTFTVGTNGTAVNARLRLDSVTGTIVGGNVALTAVAANVMQLFATGLTGAAEIAGRLVVLTVQQTAASANGTAGVVSLIALPQF